MKKVLVTGATGFTGSRVVPLLIAEGFWVRCLVRASSDRRRIQEYPVDCIEGDLKDVNSLSVAMEDVDYLINVASIGFGHAPNIVKAAVQTDIERAVFISTTAIFTTLNVSSKKVRVNAEQVIKKSPLQYTILRPTMIYGSTGDRNMSRLLRYLKKYPFLPIFGNGKCLQQPVYVEDVAWAAVAVLNNKETIGKAYNIPGADALTMNQVVDTISILLGTQTQRMHLPAKPFVSGLTLLEKCGFSLPLKSEQILRLNEDKTFPWDDAARDFGYNPFSFKEGVSREIRAMGLDGGSEC